MKTRKLIYFQFLVITLILLGMISSCKSTGPEDKDEYFLYGSVKDESGNPITGADVFIFSTQVTLQYQEMIPWKSNSAVLQQY